MLVTEVSKPIVFLVRLAHGKRVYVTGHKAKSIGSFLADGIPPRRRVLRRVCFGRPSSGCGPWAPSCRARVGVRPSSS
eukprot:scaffold81137_cov52-Attheya_sp.AAC.4